LRLIGRYVFREILTSAVLGTLLATFVIFLQRVDRLFAVLVGSSNATVKTVLLLFAWAMPPVLPLTIPFGVLVGILIGLGRMAADGEITAMRAAGLPSRKVIAPVLLFAAIGTALAGFASLRLTPLSIRESTRIINDLVATQLSAEIQPRVFDEDFPNRILYVGDVRPGPVVVWKNVFIADVTPPEQRTSGMEAKADGPLITVAREAIAVSDPKDNRIQLSLRDYSSHEMGKDGMANDEQAPRKEQALDAKPPTQQSLASSAMNTRQLIRYPRNGPDWIDVKIELHRRFALPVACIMLALVGIPLGVATRKGGKSAGYVIALFLGFFCYYLSFISLVGLAKQRALPVPVAVWLPDIVFGLAGVVFLFRMEMPGDRDLLGSLQAMFGGLFGKLKLSAGERPEIQRLAHWKLPLLPQIVDTYIISGFLFYLVVVLASFVSMTLVYNFFELMGDMVRNKIPLSEMFTYLFFLTPQLVYQTLPISVLVAVLVNFGVLSKQNEITAFRACGVSLHRLAMPILLGSTLFSGGLFAFDFYYVPQANRRQEALRDEIKGRPKQTYLRPDRKWIMGYDSRIYYYRYFDPGEKAMLNVNVFELEPNTYRLTRQVLAERAHWSPSLKTWVFENGWVSNFQGAERTAHKTFQATTFPELTEPPDYFLKEAVQDKQMNFLQLQRYIADLSQSGFDTVKFQVQLHRKFSTPLFVLIMAMIAVPFGFLVGNRGAMTGIGLSIGIALGYWGIGTLFEKIGDVNQLPPAMAAWSPDVVFSLTGLYLLLRMRS
jgi:LPS export ABC transporter permease LptG/LPS export ABC transporter permease LptF